MDILKTTFGDVDLDDDETYARTGFSGNSRFFIGTNHELWERFTSHVGYVYLYTHHFAHHEAFAKQWPAVVALCAEFAAKEREMRWSKAPESNRWFQKLLFRLTEETENMC